MTYYKQVRTQQYEPAVLETSTAENTLATWIERFGGVDGILNRVQQLQKIIQTLQQFAPILKGLTKSAGGGLLRLNEAEANDDSDSADYVPVRRRRRKKSVPAAYRRRRNLSS